MQQNEYQKKAIICGTQKGPYLHAQNNTGDTYTALIDFTLQ